MYSANIGNDGLPISSDAEISPSDEHTLMATVTVRAGDRSRLSILAVPPERLDHYRPEAPDAAEIDRRMEETIELWRGWSTNMRFDPKAYGPLRHALRLPSLPARSAAGREGARPYGITRLRRSSTLCSIRSSRFFRAFSSSPEREEPPAPLTVVCEEDDIVEMEPFPS